VTFDEVLPTLKAGKKIRRSLWGEKSCCYQDPPPKENELTIREETILVSEGPYCPTNDDIFANDWEIVDDAN
jgi:hypothetical protein